MFRQPANKLSNSGRVKRAAQASGEDRSRVSSFVSLAHVLFTIEWFSYDLDLGKCSLFDSSANGWKDKNMASSFSRQRKPNMEKA